MSGTFRQFITAALKLRTVKLSPGQPCFDYAASPKALFPPARGKVHHLKYKHCVDVHLDTRTRRLVGELDVGPKLGKVVRLAAAGVVKEVDRVLVGHVTRVFYPDEKLLSDGSL